MILSGRSWLTRLVKCAHSQIKVVIVGDNLVRIKIGIDTKGYYMRTLTVHT